MKSRFYFIPGLISLAHIVCSQTWNALGNLNGAGGNPDADYIAHWDGDSWNAMGSPVSGVNLAVREIEIADDGKIYAGGSFFEIGGTPDRA